MASFCLNNILSAGCILFGYAIAHGSHPAHHRHYPVGIHLGPDYVTAMIALEGTASKFLVQQAGTLEYKAFMRGKLWDSDAVKEALNSSSQSVLPEDNSVVSARTLYGVQPTRPNFKTIFSSLNKDIIIALGRPASRAVVAIPPYFPKSLRLEIRSQLDSAGFEVLAMRRRHTLLASELRYIDAESYKSHYVLFVDLSSASLEIAILLIEYDTVETFAYTAMPELGEDAHFLQSLQKMIGQPLSSVDAVKLRSLKTQFQQLRESQAKSPYDLTTLDLSAFPAEQVRMVSKSELSTFETNSTLNMQHTLEHFVNRYTCTGDCQDGSILPRSKLTELIITGDASFQAHASLKRAVSWSKILRQMKVVGEEVPPVRGGALGAARNAQHITFSDEPDGEPNYIIHQEL